MKSSHYEDGRFLFQIMHAEIFPANTHHHQVQILISRPNLETELQIWTTKDEKKKIVKKFSDSDDRYFLCKELGIPTSTEGDLLRSGNASVKSTCKGRRETTKKETPQCWATY